MDKNYYLEDAQERHRKHPRTFDIPTEEEIEALQVNDLVKLIFSFPEQLENGCCAERMWVCITEITEDGFCGELDNHPYYLKDLKAGDRITFQKKHIAAIFVKETNELDESKFALITKRALEHREVNWAMHTDDLGDEQDSGWTLCYGGEDDDYWEDTDNTKVISLEEALSLEPLLYQVFTGEAAVYYYDAKQNRFIAEEA
ncbi:MAG: DUF2185 domain-containing protein [Ruminococcus sp.]